MWVKEGICLGLAINMIVVSGNINTLHTSGEMYSHLFLSMQLVPKVIKVCCHQLSEYSSVDCEGDRPQSATSAMMGNITVEETRVDKGVTVLKADEPWTIMMYICLVLGGGEYWCMLMTFMMLAIFKMNMEQGARRVHQNAVHFDTPFWAEWRSSVVSRSTLRG